MEFDDEDEVTFQPNKYGNPYDDAILPALRSVPPENETEDDRIKREIWEEVERTKNSRLAKEEAERKRRAALRKKQTSTKDSGPMVIADEEASEKLLAQRRKREEERKKLQSMRQQSSARKQVEDDVIVSSPKKTDIVEPKKTTASFDFAPKADPKLVEVPKPAPTPITEQPKLAPKIEPQIETKREPTKSSFSTSVTPSAAFASEDSKWKTMYEELKERFIREDEAKRNLQKRITELERLQTLQNQPSKSGDSDLQRKLERAVDKISELETKGKSDSAQIDSLTSALSSLKKKFDQQSDANMRNEMQLKQQIQNLQVQLQASESKAASKSSSDDVNSLLQLQQSTALYIDMLKFKVMKFESKVNSLENSLQNKTSECDELTKINDELMAYLSNLEARFGIGL